MKVTVHHNHFAEKNNINKIKLLCDTASLVLGIYLGSRKCAVKGKLVCKYPPSHVYKCCCGLDNSSQGPCSKGLSPACDAIVCKASREI